jgi:hypothetical protein
VPETLEDRMLPTVVFDPQFPKESVSSPPYTILNKPTVYLIFWGKAWAPKQPLGPAAVTKLRNDATAVLNSSYFGGFVGYGNVGTVTYGGSWTDSTSDPPAGFNVGTSGAITAEQTEISKAWSNHPGWLPTASSIYVVIPAGGSSGYNSPGSVTYNNQVYSNVNVCSVGGASDPTKGSTVDDWFTQTFSHELAERMTAPGSKGVTVSYSTDPSFPASLKNGNQISDGEQEPSGQPHYGYRLKALDADGQTISVKVQSFWSEATPDSTGGAGAFIVPDGNAQSVYLQPIWDKTKSPPGFTGTYNLLIEGNPHLDNSISVSSLDDQVHVVLNGETFFFGQMVDGSHINQITIAPGPGANSINIQSLGANQTVFVESGSSFSGFGNADDTVTIGNKGDMSGMLGTVYVSNNSATPEKSLTIDDSHDSQPNSQTVTLGPFTGKNPNGLRNPYAVQFAGLGTVVYAPSQIAGVTVDGGPNGNTFNVQGTAANLTTTINGGFGGDTVNVTPQGQNLEAILGTLNVKGPFIANTNLVIDDQANSSTIGGSSTYEVDSNVVYRNNTTSTHVPIYYSNLSTLTLNVGQRRANTINVESTASSDITTINAGAAGDTVNVAPQSHNLESIRGGLNINGPSAANTSLVIDDQSNSYTIYGSHTYEVKNNAVSRNNTTFTFNTSVLPWSVPIDYSRIASLTLNVGQQANTVNVDSTAAGATTTVKTGSVGDTVNVGGSTHTLDPIQGTVNIQGGSGHNTLNIDDASNNNSEVYTVQITQFTRSPWVVGQASGSPTQTINYSQMAYLNVRGGTNVDSWGAYSTASGTTTSLYSNSGAPFTGNKFWVENLSGTLDGILGPLVLHAGHAADILLVHDNMNSASHTYTLSTGEIQRDGMANITYDPGFVYAAVYAANSPFGHPTPNTINLLSLGPISMPIVAGAGDTVNVGQSHSMARILGTPILSGQPKQVVFDDTADPQYGRTIIFNNDGYEWGISGLAPGRIYFGLNGPSSAKILGGSPAPGFHLGNTYNIQSFLPGLNLSIEGGTGNDAFLVQSPAPAGTSVSLIGNVGNDTLFGPNVNATWSITNTNAGNVAGVSFSNMPNLTGGKGVDVFKFSNGKGVAGTINGGGGGDWLDYASYATPVTVNLAAGTATGVGDGVTNVPNVRGGQGGNVLTGNALGNILIGGAGANTINGGSGRSILISDEGLATVKGGSADDIVIGGYTNYDASSLANDLALEAILAEWQSSDSYLTRISRIKAGLPGGYALVWGTTVHDTGKADSLTGGGGMSWFFEGPLDTVTDHQAGEQIN